MNAHVENCIRLEKASGVIKKLPLVGWSKSTAGELKKYMFHDFPKLEVYKMDPK